MTITSTDPMLSLAEVQRRSTEILLEYCQHEHRRAQRIAPAYGRLWLALSNQISHGGKRLRPYLCLLAYEAHGGTDREAALRAASAWELLHIGLLAHDDIIDRDYMRHGQPNVAGEYLNHYEGLSDAAERQHAANSAALLGGDLFLMGAHHLVMNQAEFSAEQRIAFCQMLATAMYEVGGGELLDSEAAFEPVMAVNPELIAQYKTASYTFIGPLAAGAALAGAKPTAIDKLRDYGLALGIGYQLADDLLGTFGSEAATGKPADSDLREAKRTAVLVQGLAGMTTEGRALAEAILAKPTPLGTSDVAILRGLLEQSDARLQIESRLDALEMSARQAVATMHLAEPYQQALTAIAASALRRDR